MQGEFAGESCFARTLQAGEHDYGRWIFGERQPSRFATEDRSEFLLNNLDYLLGRIERLRNFSSQCSFGDLSNELINDNQCNVGI